MMYIRPEVADAYDHFWGLIRENLRQLGINAPHELSQTAPEFDVWLHPDLVLSQTCGMPYRLWLQGKVQYVGTSDYGLDACPPGYYRSPIIVRRNDPRTELQDFKKAIFAHNSPHSQSGFASIFTHLQDYGFWFENMLDTGGHHASAHAVATGRADIAALDAVTWQLIQTFEPWARDLRVLEWTTPTPGLPLICGPKLNAKDVLTAVEQALDDLPAAQKALIKINRIVQIPKSEYLAVPSPDHMDYSVVPT